MARSLVFKAKSPSDVIEHLSIDDSVFDGTKYRMPALIRFHMMQKGLEASPSSLSRLTGLPVTTTYRLLDPRRTHKSLTVMNRLSEALGWEFNYTFRLATTQSPAKVSKMIKEELKRLGQSEYWLSQKIYANSARKAGQSAYTTGGVQFTNLRTYATICTILEIEPKTLAKAFLRIHHLVNQQQHGKLTELEARHLNLDLKLKLFAA